MEETKLRIHVILGFLGLLIASIAQAESRTYVFVSFSMPQQLLSETLQESTQYHLPVILNGLHHNSMPETIQTIQQFSKAIPGATFEIDPTMFERFSIQQVPALVVESGDCFDVIYGNLSLSEGLSRIEQKGECQFKKPRSSK